VTPFRRRVATLLGACVAIDLYGYAIYHAWQTHLIGPRTTLLLLSIVAALGLVGLALAPAWIQRARGEAPPAAVEPRAPRPRWFLGVMVLASIAGGAALAFADWIFLAAPGRPVAWLVLIGVNAVFVGLDIFTLIRLRHPTRIGIALGVALTIQSAFQLTPGPSLARMLSFRFVFALIQAAVFYLPLGVWAGHLWWRVMNAIFTPPRR
jgi:hypothetical protein